MPECGARDAVERRYTTGGGWRTVDRCRECGARVPTAAGRDRSRLRDPRDLLAVGAGATALVAASRYLRRKRG